MKLFRVEDCDFPNLPLPTFDSEEQLAVEMIQFQTLKIIGSWIASQNVSCIIKCAPVSEHSRVLSYRSFR